MSLFGGQQPTSTGSGSGSNLFSLNLNTGGEQSNKKRASLFDIPPPASTSQSTAMPSLFASTPKSGPPLFGSTATSSAPTGGLFGSNTTTTAPSGGLFGSTATTLVPSGSLFGSGAATSAPSGGLFGNTTATSKPSGGIFGSTTTTSAPTGGVFGGGTASKPAEQQGNNTSQAGQAGQNQNGTRDPANFSSLLERQKKRARLQNEQQNGRTGQMPELSMDLGDLARRAQTIGGRKATITNGADSRAHYLLAGSGVSPGKAYKDFTALESETGSSELLPLQERFDPDNGKYFKDLQQKGRKQMMKENMVKVYREVDAFIEESLGIDFDQQKLRIMEHFGLIAKEDNGTEDNAPGSFGRSPRKSKNGFADSANPSTRSVFGRSALDKSLIGTPGLSGSTTSFFGGEENNRPGGSLTKGQSARDLRDKERLYIEKVEQLNAARLEEKAFPIMQQFGEVEQSAGGDSPAQIVGAYHALREITKETSDPTAVKERQYASIYLEERGSASKLIKLKRQILDGSRSYLEKAFYKDLEILVEKNPREAQLGGRPTVANKVRAFIRVRAARRDLAPDGAELQQIGEEGDYCWILIFYLLRSGFVNEAAEYVNNDPAFQSTDKRFVSYLTTYARSPDRRLSRKLQEMINGEYQQRLRIAPEHSVDPYRMACYKIVGRCDLSRRNLDAIGQGVEDWIWLQFALAREVDRMEELAGESYGLDQIQETVAEIGKQHFGKGQAEGSGGYGTFFFMQILAGMFEDAIAYLHTYNSVSAVHFAIALVYYGLLRVVDYTVAGNELIHSSSTGQPQINFVPLVAYYTASFRAALPIGAVDYFALICLNSDLTPSTLGSAQTSACHECLRQLCLETREFARLLGDIRSDGTRIPGAIELKSKLILLTTHTDFLKAVTIQAAAIASERGQVADAVLLYHLSEDYDAVVSILNRSLADACTLDLGESPMLLQPLKPRSPERTSQSSSQTEEGGPQSSLSLTQSTSSPIELARNMISLYNANAAYYSLISAPNRTTILSLLSLLTARAHLEASPPRYMSCLEELNALNILPLQAQGSIPVIRSAASAFGALPQLLARCAGVSVVWAVKAIGGERAELHTRGGWQGNDDELKEQLGAMAKDLMVFAGLVKYRLPGKVYDLLTKVGGEIGGY